MKPLNVFLGYDSREHDAYMVAKASIERRASVPVLITPLVAEHLHHLIPPPIPRDGKLYDPESDAFQSTEFARSRFCIPYLQNGGMALFIDLDIVCLTDIKDLFYPCGAGTFSGNVHSKYAVKVVKHDYQPTETTKMDGRIQTAYPRKNWSSVLLWNLDHPAHARLTKQRLAWWPGRDLHAFKWLQDDEIGELHSSWNHLCGVTPFNPDKGGYPDGYGDKPNILHYTNGGPWIPNWKGGEFDEVWKTEYNSLL